MINIFRHIRNRRERKLRERCLRYSIKVNEGRADKYQIIWYADRCYDCKSPERICRGLTVLWAKPSGIHYAEVIFIDEALGM